MRYFKWLLDGNNGMVDNEYYKVYDNGLHIQFQGDSLVWQEYVIMAGIKDRFGSSWVRR